MTGRAWLLTTMVGALAAQAGPQTAEPEAAQLRERLLQEFKAILETRETARGLIVSVDDLQFDAGTSRLISGAREKLARISGILLAYPDLKVETEGHGAGAEERARAVREYLLSQGVTAKNAPGGPGGFRRRREETSGPGGFGRADRTGRRPVEGYWPRSRVRSASAR